MHKVTGFSVGDYSRPTVQHDFIMSDVMKVAGGRGPALSRLAVVRALSDHPTRFLTRTRSRTIVLRTASSAWERAREEI